MDRQQQEAQGLPPMVFAAKVCLLMGDNVLQILSVQLERQIDSRPNDAQDKRRPDILTLVNVVLAANGRIHLSVQTPIADGGIEQHHCYPGSPKDGSQGDPNL